MMYLSRIELDLSKRDTQFAFVSLNKLHGAISRSFDNREKTLWRIDSLNNKTYLLMLSDAKPNLDNIQNQFGYKDKVGETKDYDQLLNRIEKDSVWHFRLVANPTYSDKKNRGEKRGKVKAHITTEYQLKWLKNQSEKRGFSLIPDSFNVTGSSWKKFWKLGRDNKKVQVSILEVAFEGVLKIEDAELFKETLINGIGRGKAYGMGLLTVVRCGQ